MIDGASTEEVLKALLAKLHERQDWCPYCGDQVLHDEGCVLEGRWFSNETGEEGNG